MVFIPQQNIQPDQRTLGNRGQLLALVNLNALVDGARPVAFVKLDVRAGMAHGLKHDDDSPVDGLLIEILTAAAGKESHRIPAPELFDVMLLADLLQPGKIAGIGAVGGIALGGLHLGQIGFDGSANRP